MRRALLAALALALAPAGIRAQGNRFTFDPDRCFPEINTRTDNDAQSSSDMRVVIIRLDDILRRLDRAGIR